MAEKKKKTAGAAPARGAGAGKRERPAKVRAPKPSKSKSKSKSGDGSAPGGRVRVTLVRGWAGKSQVQVRNLRALGLRRRGDSRELPDVASVRGVISVVSHLVSVEAAT